MDLFENAPGIEPENSAESSGFERKTPEEPVYLEQLSDAVQEPAPAKEPEPLTHAAPACEQSSGAKESFAAFPPEKPRREKPEREGGRKGWKAAVCAVLAVALLVGSCAVTAGIVNSRWEKQTAAMEKQFRSEIDLMTQMFNNKLNVIQGQLGGGTAAPGNVTTEPITVLTGPMNPGQVYAQNVNSVVLIYNEITTNIYGQATTGTATGSGFILTEDGYVVTNHHVIEGNGTLTVITSDGTHYPAQLIGSDSTNDVAVLKVEATGLQPVKVGSSDELKIGDQVAAIGNPLGELTSTLTVGYVSAKERDVTTDNTVINMIQTDAAINSGNSGGPLFNMKGEVVGITTAKYSGTTSSGASIEGIGFAIPVNDVKEILSDLMTYGYVNSAYLGVMVRNMNTTEMAAAELYDFPVGVYVDSVEPGNCAAAAGVREKDIIIDLGGYEIRSMTDLTRALRKLDAGDTTTITVFRSGKEVTMSITLDLKPQQTQQEPQVPEFSGEMPSDGSFEEWYDYFFPFFGGGND